MTASVFFSGCQNQEIGRPFLFKGLNIGSSSYFGADSATKKTTDDSQSPWRKIYQIGGLFSQPATFLSTRDGASTYLNSMRSVAGTGPRRGQEGINVLCFKGVKFLWPAEFATTRYRGSSVHKFKYLWPISGYYRGLRPESAGKKNTGVWLIPDLPLAILLFLSLGEVIGKGVGVHH
jgi:hypothetical protein